MIGIVCEKRTRLKNDNVESDSKKRKVEEVRRRSARIKAIVNLQEVEEEAEKENEDVLQPLPVDANNETSVISDYEKMRLKNIEENQKFFASLEIFQTKQDMLTLTPGGTKKPSNRGLKREKKKTEPIIRRPPSLRLQRIAPSGEHLPAPEIVQPVDEHPRKPAGPLEMTPTNIKHEGLENLNRDFSECMECLQGQNHALTSLSTGKKFVTALKNLKLTEEHVAKVVPYRIYSLAMHPSTSKLLVGVGERWGRLGIWDVESKDENDGVYLFEPHSRAINCLIFSPANSMKLFSCSYDGTVRCGDLNKLVFDEVYATDPDEDEWVNYMDLLSPDGSQFLLSQNSRGGYAAVVDQRAKRFVTALKNLKLTEEHVAKVVPYRIYSLAMHPSTSKLLVGVGERWGRLGIWDVESKDENDGVYLFEPHSRAINCLIFSPANSMKLFSCSYDGTVRCGDLNKLVFDEVYATDPDEDEWVNYMDLLSPDGSQFLLSQNSRGGYAAVVDQRAKSSAVQTYKLHDRNMKTVSIHPLKKDYFITASNDATVALWDLRMLKDGRNKSISYLQHAKSASSAFFSPLTGKQVLTTSADDNLRIADFSNVELELKTKIRHNNFTGRWLTNFRAQWHPRFEDIFVVGSMERPRRIEIFNTEGNILQNCMDQDYLTSVCSINVFHPSRDILCGGNSSGRAHVFM